MKNWNALKRNGMTFLSDYRARFYLFLATFLLPGVALADGGDDVNSILQNVISWSTGQIAQGFVVIFVMYTGYSFLAGKMDKNKLMVQLIGAGLIFGAQYYAQNVFLKGVTS